ncbi:MAG: hypothetical protein ACTHNG_12535 [Ginsengibacter sp.]
MKKLSQKCLYWFLMVFASPPTTVFEIAPTNFHEENELGCHGWRGGFARINV